MMVRTHWGHDMWHTRHLVVLYMIHSTVPHSMAMLHVMLCCEPPCCAVTHAVLCCAPRCVVPIQPGRALRHPLHAEPGHGHHLHRAVPPMLCYATCHAIIFTCCAVPPDCLDVPYVIHFTVALVMAIIFTAISVITTAADFELNPLDKVGAYNTYEHTCIRRLMQPTVQ